MGLTKTDTVLDAACGLGESTRFLSREYGCRILGVDLSRKLAQNARSTTYDPWDTNFLIGDEYRLPFRDNTFTAAISECSMCLMPELGNELGEIFRTLKPRGKIGITDIVTNGKLPPELEEVLMRFLCISTISVSTFRSSLEAEGFERVEVSDQTGSLRELLDTIKKRLLVAELLTSIGKLSLDRDKLDRGKRLLSLSKTALEQKNLGYAMITAQKTSV